MGHLNLKIYRLRPNHLPFAHHLCKVIVAGLFSFISLSGFAQSGTILINGSGVAVSGSTKFPIWLSAGQTVNISSNVSSISGILYNITASSAGGNILTMNSVVNITSATTVLANTTLKLEGVLFTTASTSNPTTWNIGGNTTPSSPVIGSTDNSAIAVQSGTGPLSIVGGNITETAGGSINETVGSNYTLNGTSTSNYSIGTGSTSGSISIGGAGSTTAIGGNETVAGTLGVSGTATFSNGAYAALFPGGKVGIGNSTPVYPLDVTGSGRFTTSVTSPSHIFTNTTNGNTVTLQSGVTTTGYPLTLPLAQATASGQVLTNDGTGILTWASPGSVTGSGTQNYITKWTVGGTGLVNSHIYDNGASVGIGTASPNATAALDITSTTQGFLPPRMTTAQRGSISSPVAGLMIYNTDINCLQFYNGTIWVSSCAVNATGGAITTIPGYEIITFTSSGTFTANRAGTVSVLVVAGGGGGGGAGGGGGGGVIYNTSYTVTTGQSIPVTVGAGGGGAPSGTGTIGTNGGNSIFGTLTAYGGGGGAGYNGGAAQTGGSGGGGGSCNASTGAGVSVAGQGYSGGNGSNTCSPYTSGGGGGAGAVGANASGLVSGAGGAGILCTIDGNSYYYGGGGGGGSQGATTTPGNGGIGGGGGGAQYTAGGAQSTGGGSARSTGGAPTGSGGTATGGAGGANTGGGGGGMGVSQIAGGVGGSGIVIVAFPN
jgi:fibronectin-binding autotransporter adhesin